MQEISEVIDFTGVAVDFEAVPVATYPVRVFSCEKRLSQGEQNPYLAWQFAIVGGEYDNRRLWHNTSLLPQALWNLKRVLSALGYDETELSGPFKLNPAEYVGLECAVLVSHEIYEGRTRSRVERILPAEEGSLGAPF